MIICCISFFWNVLHRIKFSSKTVHIFMTIDYLKLEVHIHIFHHPFHNFFVFVNFDNVVNEFMIPNCSFPQNSTAQFVLLYAVTFISFSQGNFYLRCSRSVFVIGVYCSKGQYTNIYIYIYRISQRTP